MRFLRPLPQESSSQTHAYIRSRPHRAGCRRMLRRLSVAFSRPLLGAGAAACAFRCAHRDAAAEAAPLAGKKAVVFGGTSGIGLATAQLLCAEGASVVAVSRDPSKCGEQPGLTLAACDVQDRAALTRLLTEHGPVDVLVSAATGGERAIGPFLEMDIDGYRNSFAKLWGYANVVQCGAPHLAPEGCVVLVSAASPAPQHPRLPATPSPPPPPPSPALPHPLGERRAGPQAQEGAGRARLRGGGGRAARACRRP